MKKRKKTIKPVSISFIGNKKIMDSEEKKQFRNNVIKFIIGAILLIMSYVYIQWHPAEKISIFSGFEVMFQKVEIFFQNIFGNRWELLKKKYDWIKSYQELVNMAENNKCVAPEIVQEVNEVYKTLKDEKIETLESKFPDYIKKAYEFESEVKKDCPN